MDQVLALEALSALTGATVKPHTDFQGGFARATDVQVDFARDTDVQVDFARDTDVQVDFARDTDVQGGFARDTDVQGGFARDTDVQVGFARDTDVQGGFARDTDVQEGFARDTDVQGGFARATDVQRGFARAGSFNELTIDNFLLTVFGLKSGSLIAVRGFSDSVPERELFVNINNFFDSGWDYDFRSGGDSSSCSRGGESYTRPWGWYRFALKALNKYPDGNNWLGTSGWRSDSSPGEWPVSFHGTNFEGAEGIASSHYKPGERKLYGRGIYSTPNMRVAESYTTTFRSKTDGKTYEVIMQNRINPQMRTITSRSDYWLIPIPAGTSPSEEKSIVERSIRPYGILLKQV